MILVDIEQVAARRPDRPLFEHLSLTLRAGDRLGVVGRNGTGKSTLLRVIAGTTVAEAGTVRRGRGVRVGFLSQRPDLGSGTVGSIMGRDHESGQPWEAAAILDRLGMAGLVEADVATLSGGQAKRLALAKVLVEEVDLLILDEPTNHLDLDAIAWLEARLARFRGGLVVITHDRHVLDRVTTRILELDRGQGYLHEGGYASYLEAAAMRTTQEATADSVRRNLARRELAWLRRGAPARTRKPKARIAAATTVVENRGPVPDRTGPLDLAGGGQWGPTPRLGDRVITLGGVGHRFDDHVLFEALDYDLGPGDRLGIVGPNGSGKSTLLEIMAKRLQPAAGEVRTGPTVRLAYYDQTGRTLDPARRVREAVAGTHGQPTWEQARLMERFWFDADAQWAPIGTLSGGEQRRLQLLLVLAAMPNVVLLDEPTNDLDLDTLRALEDHFDHWPGTLVVVSHDRAFLERTVEDVIILDGHGGSLAAAAGYSSFAASGGRPSFAAVQPDAIPSTEAEPPPAAEPSPVATRVRSPSTLRRLLGLAERDMVAAGADRDRLADELRLAADAAALASTAHALATAEAAVAEAEERWLTLAEELGM